MLHSGVVNGLLEGSEDHRRGFRRIVTLLILLVIVPTALLLGIGILMLVFWRAELNLVFGILVVTLVGCLVTGAVLSLVFLRREENLSKLQLDFVSKVSHELRTPLTSIRMFVEMLQMKRFKNDEEVDVALNVLAKETGRLTERIERLLDWGRMEAGRRIYELKVDRPEFIARDAVHAFEATTVGRSVPILMDVEDGLPEVLADRGAMVDAFVNLLSNAYKYSGGNKEIALRVFARDGNVCFAVTDKGPGIAKSEHRRIFQKFYRVDDRLSRAVEGSGLGLAIVRHVALGHRGKIEVDSAPGKGSTFTFVLQQPTPEELERVRNRPRSERPPAMVDGDLGGAS